MVAQRLDRLIEASFDDALGEAGIDRRQWQILNVVTGGAVRDAELAQALSPFVEESPVSLGGIVDDLQARKWLARDDNGALLLTPDGASAMTRRAPGSRPSGRASARASPPKSISTRSTR